MKEPVWLDDHDALAIHGRLLALHGGARGIRDHQLLESALARPHQHYAYGQPDIVDLAAAYTAGIIRNHPFIDGNKRTGFLLGALFLEINGYRFTATEEDTAQAVIALAASTFGEDGYAAWLRANVRRSRPAK